MRTKTARRALLCWIAFLLLLGIAACFVLYQYLAVYEISRPEQLMDGLMAEKSPDDWYAEIKDRPIPGVSEFEKPGELLENYYRSKLCGAKFSYRRDTVRSNEREAVFIVRAGSVNFAEVTLGAAENGALRFGRHLWAVERIEPADVFSSLHSVRAEILAFPDQEIRINGVPVGTDYLVEDGLLCPGLSELEQRFSPVPTVRRYRVERLFGEISVTTGEGRVLIPAEEGSVVHYDASAETLYRIEIYAPEDVRLSLCGAELTSGDAVSRGRGSLAGLEPFIGQQGPDTLHYLFEGLHVPPILTAQEPDGTALEPVEALNGALHLYHANDAACEEELSSWAGAYFDAYINYSIHIFSDERQGALLSRILPGTQLYDYILYSKDTMLWAVGTTVNEFEDLRFTDFHRISENCFTCNVRYRGDFTMNARQSALNYEEENTAELCFVRVDGRYLCSSMSFLTD